MALVEGHRHLFPLFFSVYGLALQAVSMRTFVTVGSTGFNPLIDTVLSEAFLRVLHSKGYSKLVVQCGNSTLKTTTTYHQEGLDIEIWRFKDSLQHDYQLADLVISHAGKGLALSLPFLAQLKAVKDLARS